MSLAVTLYIIVTLVLFSLNMVANIFALALGDKKEFPLSTFIATIVAMGFVIWGITLLVVN
jgi:uncharacterized membrane protein YciS (DUF1049 family)